MAAEMEGFPSPLFGRVSEPLFTYSYKDVVTLELQSVPYRELHFLYILTSRTICSPSRGK